MAHSIRIGQAVEPAVKLTTALPIVRCPHCAQRLFDGYLVGKIKCPRGRCRRIVEFVDKRRELPYGVKNY